MTKPKKTNLDRAEELLDWLDAGEVPDAETTWWEWYRGEVKRIKKALNQAELRGFRRAQKEMNNGNDHS